MASPMPCVDPVTRAVLPLRSSASAMGSSFSVRRVSDTPYDDGAGMVAGSLRPAATDRANVMLDTERGPGDTYHAGAIASQ